MASQIVRALVLNRADSRGVFGDYTMKSEPAGLRQDVFIAQAKHRLLRPQLAQRLGKLQVGANTEKRRQRAAGLNLEKRRRAPFVLAKDVGEARNRGRLIENRKRQFLAKHLLDAREHGDGQQRMAAKLEEIIGDPDGPDVQSLFPDFLELALERIARRDSI